MPESTVLTCCCPPIPGTTTPGIAPYVVSLQSLHGIISLGTLGGITITTQGNTIYFSTDGTAGLGTVTSVQATSNNSNLTVTGGPVTVAGTFTFDLAGNLDSISGLVMAADQMLYSTAADTFAATSLTAFARTLLDDAAAVNARSTLGLVIGTNVQAWSADLDTFVTVGSWSGVNLTLTGDVNCVSLIASGDVEGTNGVFSDNITAGDTITATLGFTGPGGGITAISGTNITTGTVDEQVGGTGNITYTAGDILQATNSSTLTRLPSVSAASYLRSAGIGAANVWSTLKLPNAATTGDILMATSADTVGVRAGVATGNVLRSGGVGAVPTYGKVTSSHVDSTIPTMSGGITADLTGFSSPVVFTDSVASSAVLSVAGELWDGTATVGFPGQVLTTTGVITQWSSQITLDTLVIETNLGIEGTITGAGTTGNQTINKPQGTVRVATGNGSVIVTNSLCTTSHRVHATVCTNDANAYVKNVVTTNGSFTIVLGANAAAETEIFWTLFEIT